MNELRRDPVSGRWTIVLIGEEVKIEDLLSVSRSEIKQSGETCPFCEGNEHATPPEIFAIRSPDSYPNSPGWKIRVIPDQNPILQRHGDIDNRAEGMYDVLNGIGAHEILIEHPHHNINIPEFSTDHMVDILKTMQFRIKELKKDPRFRYVLIHKNYGEATGNTLRHAYSQILATPITPRRIHDELFNAKEYFGYKERCVFCDIVEEEVQRQKRVVLDDGKFVVFEPFASGRPFETWIVPREHETFFENNENLRPLGETFITIMTKIKKLLDDPSYLITLHNGPNISVSVKRGYWKTLKQDFHWHFEIVPRLRSRSSFELGSGIPINPVAPEVAAQMLRENA